MVFCGFQLAAKIPLLGNSISWKIQAYNFQIGGAGLIQLGKILARTEFALESVGRLKDEA